MALQRSQFFMTTKKRFPREGSAMFFVLMELPLTISVLPQLHDG